ncbi:uncharacterized protein LOC130895811 [Diorhabda carinulata]|uniref:uncharacterized protein LOC130895811 n=1 Tax=Diorhabda carinulata TaxID=1163345 RepID=UPI0025A2613D|nr:uncharacterized protein LOC130895811 [Diorhabda carinulata]
MGQHHSCQEGKGIKRNFPLTLFTQKNGRNCEPNPQQPIKFQYISKKKNNSQQTDVGNRRLMCRLVKTQSVPVRTKSEPNLLFQNRGNNRGYKRKQVKNDWKKEIHQFGYQIRDVDAFFSKATIKKPANIPVVLASPSILYQTRLGGYQAEVYLPLGMVVNAVFKNQHWLYVQTPHGEEGYVSYAACIPLGIIPPPNDDKRAPCWEKSTDVFPKPSGNLTDTEKLSSKSDCEGEDSVKCRSKSPNDVSTCGEKSIDRLYLRAAKTKGVRHTLLVILTNFCGNESNNISVQTGDVVVLLDASIKGWFYVKDKKGEEGYIPASIVGHGFL